MHLISFSLFVMPIISSCFSFVLFMFSKPLRCPCYFPILLVFVLIYSCPGPFLYRLLLFLVLSGFPFFFALCLLLSLLFPPLCCTYWHLMSKMKIGRPAGKYSMCIVLGPSQKKQNKKAKRHQSALVDSYSAPVFFCLVYFRSLLMFLCCGIYPVGPI